MPLNKTIEIDLNAAIVAVRNNEPVILTVGSSNADNPPALPFGPFDPEIHRTLEIGLRSWVEEQTQLNLGYVEQLYTFGDRDRLAEGKAPGPHVVSVSYLALTRASVTDKPDLAESTDAGRWSHWYGLLPWEDWRAGRPGILDAVLLPKLANWASSADNNSLATRKNDRTSRFHLAFGVDPFPWDEERVLERYELLYEAGLVVEARRVKSLPANTLVLAGEPMSSDHRRILATAIARLRGKLKYRPVMFELMAETFTLTELQRAVEAIMGHHLHKQNFRRLVETGRLVEPTGAKSADTGGRPAALFRFRKDVLRERPAPGFRISSSG